MRILALPRARASSIGWRRKKPHALTMCAAWALSAGSATAGNLDAFYLSGDAALQGGAITADSQGGGSLWYNPAGMASIEGTRLDVSANGYALTFGGRADFNPTNGNAQVTSLSKLDLTVVPAALTITRNLGPVGIGLGVFVPAQNTTVLRTEVDATDVDPGTTAFEFGYDSTTRFQEYHVGPGFGWKPSDKLALGGALMVNYRTLVETVNVAAVARNSDEAAALSSHRALDAQRFGLSFTLGGQIELTERLRLGLVARTPALRLGENVQRVETELLASNEFDDKISFDQSLTIETGIWSPFRFHGGLSYSFDEFHGALEANLQLPFENEALDIELRPTWNVRVGAKRRLGPRFAVGGGVFTDQSPSTRPDEFQESRIDFYGATASVQIGNQYGTFSKNGQPFEQARLLRFGTTVALSYAVGLGSVVNAQLGVDPVQGVTFDPVRNDVLAHEITLHIASAVWE